MLTPAHRLPTPPSALLGLAAAAGAAVIGGGAIAMGGKWPLFVAAAAAIAVLLFLPLASGRAFAPTYLAVEAPVLLLLVSTLVLRDRNATALSDNPLDAAAAYRVACVAAALMLSLIALLRPVAATGVARWPLAFKLFVLYVVVAFLGASLSVDPALTVYRGAELLAGIAAIAATWRTGGIDAMLRIERLLYAFVVVLVATVWIGVALVPGQAVLPSHPLPFTVVGVYPHMAANGVGELGAVLFLWTLGRTIGAGRRLLAGWPLFFMALGLVTLVAAQYRTGYVGVALTLLVLAVARARMTLVLLALAATIVIGWFSLPTVLNSVQPYALRGDTAAQAEELSGRLYFWSHAIPIWEKSPVLGRGLATATRFEVLSPLGFGDTSTIHGTWIEALVGTGVVGVGLLAAFLLALWRYALPDLVRPDGRVWPALLLAFATVRSLTGSTFEIFGFTTLLLLTLAFTLTVRSTSSAETREPDAASPLAAGRPRRRRSLPA